MQVLHSLDLELAYHFFTKLLTKANHKPSSDSRALEIDSTSSWEDLQVYVAVNTDIRRPIIGAISATNLFHKMQSLSR